MTTTEARTVACGLVLLAAALVAAGPAPAGSADTLDPVVADVVRMLEAGVEHAIVLEWLRDSGARPRALAPDDLIALSSAGAPTELTGHLLALARGGPAAVGERAPERPAPAGADVPQAHDACCRVDFELDYRAIEPVEGEDEAPSMDLFVYLDGRFLARLESRPEVGGRGEVRLRRTLAPGPHTIRLTRERHTRRGRGDEAPWRHDTRVCPDLVEFTVDAGTAPMVELAWIESPLAPESRGPLDWQVLIDGEVRAGSERTGTPKGSWPPLCEDVEDAVSSGALRPSLARGDLANCVRWRKLWPAEHAAATRAEILRELESVDFRP